MDKSLAIKEFSDGMLRCCYENMVFWDRAERFLTMRFMKKYSRRPTLREIIDIKMRLHNIHQFKLNFEADKPMWG